jgi:N-acetylglucosaminyldiphosphoundecaprenol N-acetyl-beta-D-mannosaminyltransferase
VDRGRSTEGVVDTRSTPASGAPLRDAPVPGTVATQEVFGFPFVDDGDVAATVERILSPQPDDGRLPLVVTPNVDDIVRLHERDHAELLVAERRARYVLPDGQPIVWTSRLLGRPLTARLPGSTLVPPLWRRAVADGVPVVVVASSDDMADRLRAEHPGATCMVPPFFDADDAAAVDELVDRLVDAVTSVRPHLVFFGINFPKQQRLALGLHARLVALDEPVPEPVLLLIGGSFNMYFGITPRAPEWMQRWGLEWLYRFLLEPRRLFRRYFVTDAKFLPIAARAVWQERRHPSTARKEHP